VILWILLLLLALVLFWFGFTTHMLWIAAAVLLVVWVFGFSRHRRPETGG
jgi:hypothetical protein